MIKGIFKNKHTTLYPFPFLILRIGIGGIMLFHGYSNLSAGPQSWRWMGEQLSLIGIRVFPVFFGFLAGASEFLAGLCILLAFQLRWTLLPASFTMIMAIIYHISHKEPFTNPLELLVIFIFLCLNTWNARK